VKNIKAIAAAGLLGAAALGVLPAAAHHATSTFYLEEEIPLENVVVQELIWANPHGVLVVQDADGAFWVGEMAAVVDLARQGLNPDSLPKGRELDLMVLPSRDGSNRVHVQSISADGQTIYGTTD